MTLGNILEAAQPSAGATTRDLINKHRKSEAFKMGIKSLLSVRSWSYKILFLYLISGKKAGSLFLFTEAERTDTELSIISVDRLSSQL